MEPYLDDFREEVEITRRGAILSALGRLAASAGLVILSRSKAFGVPPPGQPSIPPLFHPTNKVGNVILPFGVEWKWAKGCDDKWKRHAGVDIGGAAKAGTKVFAAYDGTVMIKFIDSTWKGCVVIEHADSQGRKFTTTYWHVDYKSNLSKVKKGEQIGTISNLGGITTNHVHWGLRAAAYSAVAQRGALPYSKSCGANDPQFPEWFLRPL